MGQRLPRLTPCLPQVPRQSMSAWGRSMPGTVPTASAEVQPATAWCPVLVQMWARACMHVHTCVHPRRQCPPCPSPPASPSMCKWGAHLQPPPTALLCPPSSPLPPRTLPVLGHGSCHVAVSGAHGSTGAMAFSLLSLPPAAGLPRAAARRAGLGVEPAAAAHAAAHLPGWRPLLHQQEEAG